MHSLIPAYPGYFFLLKRLVVVLMLFASGLDTRLNAEELLNINTASPALLAERLPGIGPAKAKAIVVYREQHGPFDKLDALIQVKGIGPRTLDKIRKFLFVESDSAQQSRLDTAPDIRNSQQASDKRAKLAVRAAISIAKRAGVVHEQHR